MRRVLVTGSRDWTDRMVITDALHAERMLDPERRIVVVQGGASGADALAAWWANATGNKSETYSADWSLGKVAGHIRNQEMVDAGADVCLAFPMPGSRGTWDCVRRAEAAGIFTKVFATTGDDSAGLRQVQHHGTLQPAQEVDDDQPTLF